MQKFIYILLFLLHLNYVLAQNYKYDLTLIGEMNYEGSLTRIGINLVESLKDHLKINYIRTPRRDGIKLGNASLLTKEIIRNRDKSPGKVVMVVETFCNNVNIHKKKRGKINIAYSMLESDKIPDSWVTRINNYFDAVVVPDDFLVKVYKKCGVKVPIFVIPVCMDLNDFLRQPLKSKANNPFTFGVSATFIDRKNNEKIFDAFTQTFGNNKNFLLKMHGRYGNCANLVNKKNELKINNIQLINRPISQKEYVEFLSSIDCYVYISKGEGFSLTPREAMAMGIPCILTDNSAQSTICKTGLVEVVPSLIKCPFYLGGQCGFCYDCEIDDVIIAMKKVHKNYYLYLESSEKLREWASQYCLSKINKIFLNLIKPVNVKKGDSDIITEESLITTSDNLYKKYLEL